MPPLPTRLWIRYLPRRRPSQGSLPAEGPAARRRPEGVSTGESNTEPDVFMMAASLETRDRTSTLDREVPGQSDTAACANCPCNLRRKFAPPQLGNGREDRDSAEEMVRTKKISPQRRRCGLGCPF